MITWLVDAKAVETEVKGVYDFRPPTKTYYASEEARVQYKESIGRLFSELGLPPQAFRGVKLLDAGCGSCEKATFYSEWGADVTRLDISDSVLALAKETIGSRDIRLVKGSILDLAVNQKFDLIVSDGVLHCTADTYAAFKALTLHLNPGGHVVISLINIWGSFWWFPIARFVTRVLGGSNFHKRAEWGRRLFRWTRAKQEGTKETLAFYRSEDSWAYDWFANPRWNIHSPSEVRGWLANLELVHVASIPSIVQMENPRNWLARLMVKSFRGRNRMMRIYWLVNGAPNTMYIHAVKRP